MMTIICRHAAQTSTGLNSRVYFYNNAYAMTEENCKQITDFGPVCGSSYHSSEQVFVFKSADGYEYAKSKMQSIMILLCFCNDNLHFYLTTKQLKCSSSQASTS